MSRKTVITCSNCSTTRECDCNEYGYAPGPGEEWTELTVGFGVKPPSPGNTTGWSPAMIATTRESILAAVTVDLCPACTVSFAAALKTAVPVAAETLDKITTALLEGKQGVPGRAYINGPQLPGRGGFGY